MPSGRCCPLAFARETRRTGVAFQGCYGGRSSTSGARSSGVVTRSPSIPGVCLPRLPWGIRRTDTNIWASRPRSSVGRCRPCFQRCSVAARQIRQRRVWTLRSAFCPSTRAQTVGGQPRSFGVVGAPPVRTVFPIAFLPSSSYATCGKSAPFQGGYLSLSCWASPAADRRACAGSHLLSPLGLGLPGGRVRRLARPPMGLTVFHQQESRTPEGHPLPRGAAVLSRGRRQRCPSCPHPMLVRASPPLWPL
jgi:hypothetical protein